MGILPWVKIGEPVTLAEGYGKRLDKQRFRDHNGNETDFFFIEQPSWSAVLPITEEGNVLLVRQYKQGSGRIMDETPGGNADFKAESPEAVIKRELMEETGYEPQKIISLGSGFINSRNSTTKFYSFLATGCKKIGAPKLDKSEQIELLEIPLNEWMDFMLKGESDQWDACLTFLRALPHLSLKIQIVRGDDNLDGSRAKA